MRGKAEVFVKGMLVGSTMLVPGISGGSMAMILGIYDRLVHVVSTLGEKSVKKLLFLGTFSAGGAVGMLLFARPLLYVIECYEKPALYFFIGAVLGGIPMIGRKARAAELTWRDACWIFAGAGVVLCLALAEQRGFLLSQSGRNIWHLLLAGGIGAVALILPGISVSYLFLMLGLYDIIIKAIRDVQIDVLLPLGAGLLPGIVLTTKCLETLMERYPGATYLVILGFIMGAVGTVFPGLPKGIEWLSCPAFLAVGYILIQMISKEQ